MSIREVKIVSSGILTDHPDYAIGSTHAYEYGSHFYCFDVNGYGDYSFKCKMTICDRNTNKINMIRSMFDE